MKNTICKECFKHNQVFSNREKYVLEPALKDDKCILCLSPNQMGNPVYVITSYDSCG